VAKIDADVETLTYATNGEIFEITPLKKTAVALPKEICQATSIVRKSYLACPEPISTCWPLAVT
jgi:hypothetical protein